eukprot:10437299-Alexandrium_andersonii.AAC.1
MQAPGAQMKLGWCPRDSLQDLRLPLPRWSRCRFAGFRVTRSSGAEGRTLIECVRCAASRAIRLGAARAAS